jgi:hypothetical protein
MNKQNNSEANKQTEALADLPLTSEQAEGTKAGDLEYSRHEGAFMGNLFGSTPVAK